MFTENFITINLGGKCYVLHGIRYIILELLIYTFYKIFHVLWDLANTMIVEIVSYTKI